jgi:TolB protein
LTRITDGEHHYQSPAWSPDGKKIAVEKDLGWPNSEIYTLNPDGTGETRLTHTRYEEDKPVWSPDGKKIAVTTNRETGCQSPAAGCYTIYVMNADGSQQTRLTADTAAILEPKWSPDGSRIAFLRLPDYPSWGYDIYTVNVDGSNERRLTDDPATEWFHTWSPDSGQLAFVRDAADGARIYLINADGSGERFLANGFFPDWQRLVRSAFNNAAEFCKAQREASGRTAFEQRYRTLGSCVRQNR